MVNTGNAEQRVNAGQHIRQGVKQHLRVWRGVGLRVWRGCEVVWLVTSLSWAAAQQLEVVSNVAGAEVVINGTVAAVMPAATGRVTLELTPGSYTVQLTSPSFNPPFQNITLTAGETVTLDFTQTGENLRVGTAVIQGNVAGASVFINGAQIGLLDANGQLQLDNLIPGRYDVRLTAADYAEQTGGVTVFPGEVAVLELTQPQTATGALRILTGLQSGTVFLDGQQVGVIDAGEMRAENIPIGNYVLRIEAPDFTPFEQPITINRDQTTTFEVGR